MIYLDEATVQEHMPSPIEAVQLMRDALNAIALEKASLTPKSQVNFKHGFANAMPAAWPERNLLGMKWVKVAKTIEATILLDDPSSGLTRAILAATGITGLRTAAVTGATLREVEPEATNAAFMGTGVQARSHAQVLEALGYTDMYVWGRREAAIEELQQWAKQHTPKINIHKLARKDIGKHKIIITALAFSAAGNELALSEVRRDATLLPIDYGTVITKKIAEASYLFADDPVQYNALLPQKFRANYPATNQCTAYLFHQDRPEGRLVIQNLGSGIGDVVMADQILRNWEAHNSAASQ